MNEFTSCLFEFEEMEKVDAFKMSPKVVEKAKEILAQAAKEGVQVKSHFEAYRLAIVCEAGTQDAITRLKKMRECEHIHGLDKIDSLEAYDKVQEAFPEAFHGFSGFDKSGRIVWFANLSNFFPGKMGKDEQLNKYVLRSFIDTLNVSATSLDEFERGLVMVQNAHNIGWKNFSFKLEKEVSWMYTHGYPIRLKQVIIYNYGPIVRAIIKMCKVFLSKKIQDRILLANKDEALQELVSPDSLPSGSAHGNVSNEQIRAFYIARLQAYQEMERTFVLT